MPFAAHLLQEGDDLACAPFVWLGQVEVFEVDYDPLTVPWAIDTPSVGG